MIRRDLAMLNIFKKADSPDLSSRDAMIASVSKVQAIIWSTDMTQRVNAPADAQGIRAMVDHSQAVIECLRLRARFPAMPISGPVSEAER